LRFKPEAP